MSSVNIDSVDDTTEGSADAEPNGTPTNAAGSTTDAGDSAASAGADAA